METFSALLAHCGKNSPVAGEFPAQRPVTRSFDVFFDLLLNKCVNKWVNNRQAGDLRRHRAYHDVIVMNSPPYGHVISCHKEGGTISAICTAKQWEPTMDIVIAKLGPCICDASIREGLAVINS